MKLKLVKGKASYEAYAAENGTAHYMYVNHVTKLLKELVEPLEVKVDSLVAEDYYFTSVKFEKSLQQVGIGFIDFIKQASHQY